jgi:two-component system sensor histidine kinase TorS
MTAPTVRDRSDTGIAASGGGGSAPVRETDGQPGIPMPLLTAARRVLEQWQGSVTYGADWASVADELASLTLAVQGSESTPARAAHPSVRRELLSRLRTEIEERLLSDGAESSTDALTEACERLRAPLGEGDEPELELELAGPAGLELLADIVHDLRSPLTSILTLAETLRRGQSGAVNEIQRRQLGLIYSAALALSSTAADVMELAHGGDRLAQKEPSPFSIMEIFEAVRDIVGPLAEEKALSLRFQSRVSERRLGYPVALSRVLLNLTTNALKFTDAGFVEIVARRIGATRMEFSVRDTGKGIAPHALERLYQPFRRASGPRGYHFSGTGLGLAICRRLVAAMGSELQVETKVGWGTRFWFQLELPPAHFA